MLRDSLCAFYVRIVGEYYYASLSNSRHSTYAFHLSNSVAEYKSISAFTTEKLYLHNKLPAPKFQNYIHMVTPSIDNKPSLTFNASHPATHKNLLDNSFCMLARGNKTCGLGLNPSP